MDDLHRIALHYGYSSQSHILIEEMAELTKAIIKKQRARTLRDHLQAYENIIEEIADVEICLEQIKYLMDLYEKVSEVKESKIKRQLERMEKYE